MKAETCCIYQHEILTPYSNYIVGAYELSNGFSKSKKPNFTPFGSTVTRDSMGGNMTTPGPGAYSLGDTREIRMGPAAAFKSKSIRFPEKDDTASTPGPGQYVHKLDWVKKRNKFDKQKGSNSTSYNSLLGEKNVEAGAAVTWVRVPTAPSIPAPNQSYGYEEGQYGELIMQKAPHQGYSGKKGDVPGPGEYTPSVVPTSTHTRAVDFSRSKSKRVDFGKTGTETPGPGHYNLTAPPIANAFSNLAPSAPSAVFKSRVERKGTTLEQAATVPGPGQYQVGTSFQRREVPETHQFFGSTSQRFQAVRATKGNPSVGPGSYKATIGAFEKKITTAATGPASVGVGFASTAVRENKAKEVTPGAGAYDNHLACSIETDLKKKLVSRSGVFGTTTKRFMHAQGNDDQLLCRDPLKHSLVAGLLDSASMSSGDNLNYNNNREKEPPKPSAAYASNTKRFDANIGGKDKKPAPGEYEISQKWVKGKQGLFFSGGDRFNHKIENDLPGPGQYSNPIAAINIHTNSTSESTKHMISTAPRFEQPVKRRVGEVPGPGSYDSEYLYGNLNRPTFNMAIAQASLKNTTLL
jgi:hypothetical protein